MHNHSGMQMSFQMLNTPTLLLHYTPSSVIINWLYVEDREGLMTSHRGVSNDFSYISKRMFFFITLEICIWKRFIVAAVLPFDDDNIQNGVKFKVNKIMRVNFIFVAKGSLKCVIYTWL